MQRLDPTKFKIAKLTEQYQVKTSKSFAALENLDDKTDINRA
jgi:hypothetical protein